MDARFALNHGLYSPTTLAMSEPEQLIRMNFGLVRKIAWHIHGRVSSAIDIEELMQIGMIALIEAARAFEDRGQAVFTTYASIRIRGAMIDALRKQATLCRSALKRRRELNMARNELSTMLGRPPDEIELARHLEIPVADLHEQIAATQETRHESIDEIYSEHSIWFASEEPDAFEQLQSGDMKRALVEAIASLPEREAMVLQLYFVEELNLEEIGEVLGVGAARICQIKKTALEKVRKLLGNWED